MQTLSSSKLLAVVKANVNSDVGDTRFLIGTVSEKCAFLSRIPKAILNCHLSAVLRAETLVIYEGLVRLGAE